MLLWTFGYKYLFKSLLSNICGIYLGMASLGHMVIQCLTFWGTPRVFKIKNNLSNVICIRYCMAKAKSLQSCPTVRPHRQQPTRLPHPWDSPGKNTGVGCHFLLQCMKVKSESEVAQSCPTLSSPMDYSLPGSSAHGIFQARVLEWGAIAYYTVNICAIQVLQPGDDWYRSLGVFDVICFL